MHSTKKDYFKDKDEINNVLRTLTLENFIKNYKYY